MSVMMSEPFSAVVAGHICLDITPEIIDAEHERFLTRLEPGRLVEIGPAAFSTGGPVSNTGLALHKLGVPTRLMGKIGADSFGRIIREIVSGVSPELARGMILNNASSTSYSLIISPPGVDRIFLHSPGANHTFCAADVDYELAAVADVFHFGYPPVMRRMYENGGMELTEMFQRVKAAGVLTSLDMAFPDPSSPAGKTDWRAIFQAVLPSVDIFLPSIEELLFCLDRPLYNRLAGRDGKLLERVTPALLHDVSAELLAMGVKIVVLKLGERGFYLRTADADAIHGLGHGIDGDAWGRRELWAPCFQVNVVGTTGSGDATIAGFLAALLRGLPPIESVTMAVAVGACNVEASDALSGLRSWDETRARIASGWPHRTLALAAPRWDWDPDHQLYIGPG
jgi:sugar/nucleoside kinase (ribokinase family)